MKRPARLIALALALVLAIPASVLAEKKEEHEHEHLHEKNGEHEYEYEYEEEHEHKTMPALPEGDRAVSPAPAVSTQNLADAVQAVSADPANSRTTEAMRGLARGAGPGAPRLWVHGRPVQAGLLARGDQVLLPLRTTATAGATLSLDNASGVITLTRGPRQVRLTPGQASATVNGSPVALDAAPVFSGGAAYVSLMTLAEALVLQVLYDPVSGLVVISDLPRTQP